MSTTIKKDKVWITCWDGGWWYDNVLFDQPSWPAGPFPSREAAVAELEKSGYELVGEIPDGGTI